MTQLLSFLSKFYDQGSVRQRGLLLGRAACFHSWQPLAQSNWEVRLKQRSPASISSSCLSSSSPLTSASDDLTPTIWGQNLNTSGSYHLSLYKPCSNSPGKGYLEIALACLSEWANCKTQTSFGNPEGPQACSLAHVIPYLGLENVPALTRTHHGVIVSAPQNPKDPLMSARNLYVLRVKCRRMIFKNAWLCL